MTEAIQFQAAVEGIQLSRETRTIRGTITAYGVPTTDYRRIVIEAGALQPRMPLSRVKLLIDHDQRQPVGFMSEFDPETAVAAFKIPEGEAGDKALAEAENGLRDGLSVGINTLRQEGAFMYDTEAETYHVYAAELVETSLCAIPAYQDAGVTSVAASHQAAPPTPKENDTVPETLSLETLETTLAAHTAELDRTLETRLSAFGAGVPAQLPTYQSFGAFVQAVAGGDEQAMEFAAQLAYGGASIADDYSHNTWVKDVIRLIEKRRRVLNIFTVEPLPSEGMTLEYAKLKSNTLKVEKQAKEGDNLASGKIVLDTASTNVDTYGGTSKVSIQVIKRASSAYLTTLFKAMGIEYAKATELAVRAVVKATITERLAVDGGFVSLGAAATTYDWLDMLVDVAEQYDDLGYELAGSLVSKDVFKRLMRLEDTNGNLLMKVTGEGVNRVGSVNVKGLSGDVASVEFALLPGAEANTGTFYDPIAITTWESPGAPFRLNKEEPTNLTEDYSLYGFLAAASQFPDALVPIKFGAAA